VTRRRGLGIWLATALVVGNMIGSGIFLLPSALADFGGISIFGWLFTAVGAMLLALVFARLGGRTREPAARTRTRGAPSATSWGS
jgi:APA family basic amino acid/polyamine antiporter